jgi:hypothetical protein
MLVAPEKNRQKFAVLHAVNRVWAVAAIRGQAQQLAAMHDKMTAEFEPGDAIVYLGDIIGVGSEICATIDEVLRFRRSVLAQPPSASPPTLSFCADDKRKCGASFYNYSSRQTPPKLSIGWKRVASLAQSMLMAGP